MARDDLVDGQAAGGAHLDVLGVTLRRCGGGPRDLAPAGLRASSDVGRARASPRRPLRRGGSPRVPRRRPCPAAAARAGTARSGAGPPRRGRPRSRQGPRRYRQARETSSAMIRSGPRAPRSSVSRSFDRYTCSGSPAPRAGRPAAPGVRRGGGRLRCAARRASTGASCSPEQDGNPAQRLGQQNHLAGLDRHAQAGAARRRLALRPGRPAAGRRSAAGSRHVHIMSVRS